MSLACDQEMPWSVASAFGWTMLTAGLSAGAGVLLSNCQTEP
jgi:hypothetical protein